MPNPRQSSRIKGESNRFAVDAHGVFMKVLAFSIATLSIVASVQAQTLCPNGQFVSSPPCTLCPDGSFVGGGQRCVLAPNGQFVGGGANGDATPRLAPNGQFVGGNKPITLCPDGSFVAGQCVLAPNGKFVGR